MLPPAAAAIAPESILLRELLAVSLTGIILYTPLYDPAGSGDIVDFTFEYLNPAAQRMMAMPVVPTLTHMGQWPHSKEHGTFQFHVDAFVSGEPREYNVNYQADGYDNYYRLAARRAGSGLLVSFTDTADQPRTPVEVALREAQAAEKAARDDAETQRQRLYQVLMNLPAQVATYHGPDHVYTLVNQRYRDYFPTHTLFGRSVREAVPEAAQQGFFERLDQVYATGEPAYGQELPVHLDFAGAGRPPELIYINAFYLPLRDAAGHVDGVLDFSYNVTEQVLARQQVQQLNLELEARVHQRTLEADDARAVAVEQRNRLLRLFSQAPAEINLFQGPGHVWTLVHPRTQELLHNRPLRGLPRRQALPELPEEAHEPFDRVFRTGQPVHALETTQRLDRFHTGELHDQYYDLTLQPKFDAAGHIEGVMSFAVNVTERVRARQQAEALQADLLAVAQRQALEREAFHNVFEQTPALIALLRAPQHRFEYVNPAYQQLFPNRQLVGLDLAVAVPETREQGFVALLDGVYQTGETFFGAEVPFAPVPADGQPPRTQYFNFTYQAYREAGQIAGVTIFAFDVTEQVLARQQREAERQQLHHLFMEAPAPIVILDGPEFIFQLVNPAYQRVFPGRALLGKPVLEAMPEVAGTPIYHSLQRVYATGETFVDQELPLQLTRHDGGPLEELYFTFTYQVRRTTRGAIDGVLVFAHEVTDQVQARRVVEEGGAQARALAEQLHATNEQLTRTNIDLDNFIYTASHDLKVPIANIEGLLLALRHELPPAGRVGDVPEMLQLMQQATERFRRTIEQLTEVSKLQHAHDQPVTLVPLAAVVQEVQLDLQPLVQQTRASLTVDVPADVRLPFSEKNLRSVVYNLLSNALKYHHPDRAPDVDLTYYRHDDYHVLRVQDNGLGFDVALAAGKLFGMFQRLHAHVEGSGIGLYMVKKMVENSGGRIEVASQPGQGTTFTVFFPVHPAS
ncbi:hypothetical protein AUC43_18530 [Hymenobacter sedentarius]|uniref:histidine kinase n=1 Tax=Hymenobacter sedentarius TaxID=1411621 RepID=A0A0U4C7F4_9BACT|nr:PAS domain-containing protein [Hymenobacter sedentarius]ALW86898.1 hypothetical protein AUC43_18530 [Hymenobacter sedentarius]